MDLAHQPAQDGAWSHLNIRCDAFGRKALHDRFPSHRRRDLTHECLDGACGVPFRLRVDIRDNRYARIRRLQRPQFWRKAMLDIMRCERSTLAPENRTPSTLQ